MRLVFWLILTVPLWALAQEHTVPAGTRGNVLALSVRNATPALLRNVEVSLQSWPEWLVFKSSSVRLDSITAGGREDAVFEFRVLEIHTEESATVALAISDASGGHLGRRDLVFHVASMPQQAELLPAHPNPGNPGVTIPYRLPAVAQAKLEIFNLLGQRVRTLLDEERPPGRLQVEWDGRDERGLFVPSGTYLVRLTAKDRETKQTTELQTKVIIRK